MLIQEASERTTNDHGDARTSPRAGRTLAGWPHMSCRLARSPSAPPSHSPSSRARARRVAATLGVRATASSSGAEKQRTMAPRPSPSSNDRDDSGAWWTQRVVTLRPKSNGIFIWTNKLRDEVPEIRDAKTGVVNLFVRSHSAALTINEVRSIHWSPYDRVGVVNADPQGLLPSSLSAHTSVSIPTHLDAFQLHLTPLNSTPIFARMERPRERGPGRPRRPSTRAGRHRPRRRGRGRRRARQLRRGVDRRPRARRPARVRDVAGAVPRGVGRRRQGR